MHLLRKHRTEVGVSASGKMGREDSLGKKCNPVSPYLEDEGVALGRSPSSHSIRDRPAPGGWGSLVGAP